MIFVSQPLKLKFKNEPSIQRSRFFLARKVLWELPLYITVCLRIRLAFSVITDGLHVPNVSNKRGSSHDSSV